MKLRLIKFLVCLNIYTITHGAAHEPEQKFTVISLGRSEFPTSKRQVRGGTQQTSDFTGHLPPRTSLYIPKNLCALHTEITSNPAALLALKQDAEKLKQINELAQKGNLVARNILALIK